MATHGPQLANGGKVGGKVGGLASVATHGPQLANGGKVAKKPLIPGGPCINCGTEACPNQWCGGGGRGSKVKGKICRSCWRGGFRPAPPASLITTFFPSKKQKKE